MVRIARYRIKRRAAQLAWMAAVSIVVAVTIAFFVSAVRGRATEGTVTGKQIVSQLRCNDFELMCGSKVCYQINYVTDSGSHKVACVSQEDFAALQVGDHYAR